MGTIRKQKSHSTEATDSMMLCHRALKMTQQMQGADSASWAYRKRTAEAKGILLKDTTSLWQRILVIPVSLLACYWSYKKLFLGAQGNRYPCSLSYFL